MPNLVASPFVDSLWLSTTAKQFRALLGIGVLETLADAAVLTPNCDLNVGGVVPAMSQNFTVAIPVGTPIDGQPYTLRLTSAAVRTIAFQSGFRWGADLPEPTATTGGGKTDYMVFRYCAASSTWDGVTKNFGF